jgi:hypothetical protein
MINILVQYFIKNGHISLPEIGTLKLSKNEAFWDDGKLIAPNEYIVLEHKNVENNSHFINYLSAELDITAEEANNQYTQFLQPILSQQVASLNFGNLGTIHKNGSKITWNSLYKADVFYKNLTPSIFEESLPNKHKVSSNTNKNMIIWTIIIIALSILLIIYKNFSQ